MRDHTDLDPTADRPRPWRALGLPFVAAVLFTGVVLAATGAVADEARVQVQPAAWACPGDAPTAALPPGHPPVPGRLQLPPGHPPVPGLALPPGHPPVRGLGPMGGGRPAGDPAFEGPPIVTI